MKTVVRVRVASVAKIAAITSWLAGTAVSALLVLRRLLQGTLEPVDLIVVGLTSLGIALVGLALGVAGAWLYNLVAGWVGGIELELED